MKRERNLWVTEQTEITGKPPPDVKEFYNRFATATPADGEDEDGDKDDGGGKKAKKKEGKKEKKGKKGKKGKGGGDGEGKAEMVKIGPTEVV